MAKRITAIKNVEALLKRNKVQRCVCAWQQKMALQVSSSQHLKSSLLASCVLLRVMPDVFVFFSPQNAEDFDAS